MRASVTRAAEGFDRRSYTVEEVLRMQAAGFLAEDEGFELIEGEFVPMQAKTHGHELKLQTNKGDDVLRALKIVASGPAYDRDVKSRLYARHGVQSCGTVDAASRTTLIRSTPAGSSWNSLVEIAAQDVLQHPALPGFALRLSDY